MGPNNSTDIEIISRIGYKINPAAEKLVRLRMAAPCRSAGRQSITPLGMWSQFLPRWPSLGMVQRDSNRRSVSDLQAGVPCKPSQSVPVGPVSDGARTQRVKRAFSRSGSPSSMVIIVSSIAAIPSTAIPSPPGPYTGRVPMPPTPPVSKLDNSGHSVPESALHQSIL